MGNTSLRRAEHACADLPCSAFLLPGLGSARPLCQPGTRGGVSGSHRRRGDTHTEPGPARGQRAGSQTRLPGADGVTAEGCETIRAGGSARREYRPSHTCGHSSAHTYTATRSSALNTPTYTHEHNAAVCTHTGTRELSPCCSALRGASRAAPRRAPFLVPASGCCRAVSSRNPGWGSAGRAPALPRACGAVTGNPGAYSFLLWLPGTAGGKPLRGRTALSAELRPGSPGSWPSSGSPGLCCV